MNSAIVPEVRFFLASIGYGSLLALLYDQLRVLRTLWQHSVPAVDAEDILFFLTAGFGFFGLLFAQNDGSMRWFAFAGCGGGVLLYEKTVSRILCAAERRLIRFLLFPARFAAAQVRKLLQKGAKQLKIKKERYRKNQEARRETHNGKGQSGQKKEKKKKRT